MSKSASKHKKVVIFILFIYIALYKHNYIVQSALQNRHRQ